MKQILMGNQARVYLNAPGVWEQALKGRNILAQGVEAKLQALG